MAADTIYEIFVKDNLEIVEKKANNFFSTTSKGVDSLRDRLNKSFANGGEMLNFFTNTQSILGGVIGKAGLYSDKIADIQKTTGQTKQETEAFADSLNELSTRTSLNDLLDIAKIGGSIGVAKGEMRGFVEVIDKASVALGDEFSGGVEEITRNLGTLKTLFSETKGLKYDEAMSRIGSAINHLGSVGTATGGNISDFTKRMGQLGSLGPSLTQTLGIGATLQELGINSEIGSGGLTNLFLTAGKEADKFALQLGMPVQAFRDMLSNNPNEVILKLAQSFKGLSDAQTIQVLDGLKIGSQESIKVFQALSQNTELLVKRQKESSQAFAENSSLSDEFNIKNNTLQAQIDKTQKVFAEYTLYLGSTLASTAPLIMAVGSLGQAYSMLSPVVGVAGRGLLSFASNPTTLMIGALSGIAYALLKGSGALQDYEKDLGKVAKGLLSFDFSYINEGLRGVAHQLGWIKDNSVIRIDLDIRNPNDLKNKLGDVVRRAKNQDSSIKLPDNLGVFPESVQKQLTPLLQGNTQDFLNSLPKEYANELKKSTKLGGNDLFSNYKASDANEILTRFLEDELSKIVSEKSNRLDDISTDIYRNEDFVSNLMQKGFPITDKYSFGSYEKDLLGRLSSKEDNVLYGALEEFAKLETLYKDYKSGNLSNASQGYSPLLGVGKEKKKSSMEISGGGSRPTAITVNISKFQDKVEFHSNTINEGFEKAKDNFNEMLLRILNGATLNYR